MSKASENAARAFIHQTGDELYDAGQAGAPERGARRAIEGAALALKVDGLALTRGHVLRIIEQTERYVAELRRIADEMQRGEG